MLLSKFAKFGSALLVSFSASIFSHTAPTLAAERIVLRYGMLEEPFSVADMHAFVKTGELTPLRQFQFRLAGADPEVLRSFLNQEFKADFLTLDRTLNSLPGEFLLYQLGQVIHNRRQVAPVQSLRSAIVLSARENNTVSMLKFLENYPLSEVMLDGKKLVQIGRRVDNTRERANNARDRASNHLQTVTSMMEQIFGAQICRCEAESATPKEP
jgi:hypothetical protein